MALVELRRPAREQWRCSFQIVRRRAAVWHSSCRKALGKTSSSFPLFFSPTGVNLFTITTPYDPGGVQVGPDGTIYVADYFSGKVYRYSASGTDLGLFASTPLVQADFMAFDAGGNLYVTDAFFGVVRRISPTGVDLGDFVAGFFSPAGIAFDAQGNLYVA